MNTIDIFDLIAQNAKNLEAWVKAEITDAQFYAERARIDAILYPEFV